jgi:hypothetical protein
MADNEDLIFYMFPAGGLGRGALRYDPDPPENVHPTRNVGNVNKMPVRRHINESRVEDN